MDAHLLALLAFEVSPGHINRVLITTFDFDLLDRSLNLFSVHFLLDRLVLGRCTSKQGIEEYRKDQGFHHGVPIDGQHG